MDISFPTKMKFYQVLHVVKTINYYNYVLNLDVSFLYVLTLISFNVYINVEFLKNNDQYTF